MKIFEVSSAMIQIRKVKCYVYLEMPCNFLAVLVSFFCSGIYNIIKFLMSLSFFHIMLSAKSVPISHNLFSFCWERPPKQSLPSVELFYVSVPLVIIEPGHDLRFLVEPGYDLVATIPSFMGCVLCEHIEDIPEILDIESHETM